MAKASDPHTYIAQTAAELCVRLNRLAYHWRAHPRKDDVLCAAARVALQEAYDRGRRSTRRDLNDEDSTS